MNALQKFKQRIASRDVVTSGRIRAELKTLTALQRLSEMRQGASAAWQASVGLKDEELKAAATRARELDQDAVAFEKLHAKEIAKIHELSAKLGPIQHAEQLRMIDDLRQQFITEDAAVWAEVCRVYDAALIERAARAAAVDALSMASGIQSHLAVGFPARIGHPNSVNVASLQATTQTREIYQLVEKRTAELLAELRAEMHG
jgi:hypothetical protein